MTTIKHVDLNFDDVTGAFSTTGKSPVDIANNIKSYASSEGSTLDKASMITSALGTIETFASTVSKYKTLVPGSTLSTASLSFNLDKAYEEIGREGNVTNGTLNAIMADLTSLTANFGLATKNPYIAGFGLVASFGFSVASLLSTDGDTSMADSIVEFADNIAENYEKLQDILSSDVMENSVNASNLLQSQFDKPIDNTSSLSQWLKDNPPAVDSVPNQEKAVDTLNKIGIDKVQVNDEVYTIQKGDTLSEIAQENNTTVDKLIEDNTWLNEQNRISEEGNYVLIKPGEKLNITSGNEKTVYGLDENATITPEYKVDLEQNTSVSLKSGQTISHIAAYTDFTSTDLLEYNNLTLEQAKSLPIGFEVELPKSVNTTVGEYGNIKIFENFNEGGMVIAPNEQGFKEKIHYSETSDLLIKGDISNPNEISFTNDNGEFEVWKKDSTGSFYEATKQTEDFTIHYEKNGHSPKTVTKINGFSSDATLEDIASYTDYTANELKSFNYFDNNISDILNNDILVPSVKNELYSGNNGEIISLKDVFGNEQLMVVDKEGNFSTYDATEFNYDTTPSGSFKLDINSALGEDRTIVSNKTGEYFDTSYLNEYVGEVDNFSFAKNSQGDYTLNTLDFKHEGISIEESAKASAFVYGDSTKGLPTGWTRIDFVENSNGFYAEAYKTPQGDVVFSFRGTDGFNDLDDDAKLAFLQDNAQKDSAIQFIDNVLGNNEYKNIHLTGHSLGGHLAQEGMSYILTDDKYNNIQANQISGMGFNAPGYGEASMSDANFISVNSTSDPINLAGGGRLSDHELYLDTNKILDHSMTSLLDYLIADPLVGKYTTKTFHELTPEDKLLIEKDPDQFIVNEVNEKYPDPLSYLNMPPKLKAAYVDANARISFNKYFEGEMSFDEALIKIEASAKTMLEMKAVLEAKGNTDVADYINHKGGWKENTPIEVKQRAFLEKTEGSATSTQVGSNIGGNIGSLINANNDFSNVEKILVSTATSVIGQNIGESIYWEDKGADGSGAYDDIAVDGYKALAGSVASFAVSAYFAKNDNISDLLGMDGTFVGGILDSTVTYTATYVASELLKSGSINWGNFNPGSAIGGYLGNLAANELMGWDTESEVVGSTIGSSVALMAMFISMGPVGWVAGFFYALGASFIGNIIGGILGGLFGGTPPPPTAEAILEFDEESGTYTLISSDSADGGNEQAMIDIGQNFGKQLVNMFVIPGGQLVDANGMPEILVTQRDEDVRLNGFKGDFDSVQDMMAHALSIQIPFINVEGGDPYLLRAIHRTNEEFLEGDPDATTGRADLGTLYDNIGLAQDYSKYMNEDLIVLDENGRPITDQETLTQMNEEYKSIQAMEDGVEKTAAMEAFTDKYTFSDHKTYVDELLEEISQEDIAAYKEGRNSLISQYDTQISAANNKLSAINSELSSLEQQLNSAQKMYKNENNSRIKNEIEAHINELQGQKSLLLDDKTQAQTLIDSLKEEKASQVESYDNEHFKEIEAIHWNEVFELAEELQLDEHHYSEDFNKLNTQIAQFNYDEHEKNGELLEIDYDKYLEDVAAKMIDQYALVVAKEEEIAQLKSSDAPDNQRIAQLENEIAMLQESKSQALSVLNELGYDLETGYANYTSSVSFGEESSRTDISFLEFLQTEDVLTVGLGNEIKVEITPERFTELLALVGIEDPLESFEPAEDAFSFRGKSINDLQFELKEGDLIITTFDKDLSEQEALDKSQSFVLKDWEKWDKENTHIDLPHGTKINLDALLTVIGVEEGAGKVDVSEAFNTILSDDENLSDYLTEFESNHVYVDTSLDDKIKAFFGDNLIVTKDGDDEVHTGAGNDTIILGAGEDSVYAGLGEDTVSYETSQSAVQASLEEGGSFGDANGDTYEGVENLRGSDYNDYLTGDEGNNKLEGNAGNDILAGGSGADTLDGGEGIDLADYSDSSSEVIVNLNENYAQGGDASGDSFSNIEGVQASEHSDTVVGDDNANVVFSKEGDDRVSAGEGNDIIHGGEGNDYLKGDQGADELRGGAGNDVLVGGQGDDTLYGGEGRNVIEGGEGTDIAVYPGLSTDYEIMFVNDNTLYVKAKDGSIQDTLKNLEEIAFDDAAFGIDFENKVLVKKADFELPEEESSENDDVNNENNGSNQAAAIATAAMIGTVAAAETVETSSEEADYLSDETIKKETQEEEDSSSKVPETTPIVVPILKQEDTIFEDVQKIVAFEQNQEIEVASTVFENSNEQPSETEDTKKNENSVILENQVVQNDSTVILENQDVDTTVSLEAQVDNTLVELIEEELPELLVPTITLDTNEVEEDGVLSGIRITNSNLDSSIEVIITGVPEGVLLSSGELWSNGEWHLQQKDLEGLQIIPALHDANDFDIQIKATVTDIHGRVIQNVFNDRITIHAIADTPNFEADNNTGALEDILVPLTISTSLVDTVGGADGEERIVLSVENVPKDAVLTAGRKDEETGIWYLVPEELESLQLRPGLHNGDDFTIKVTSYTIESENDSIASISEDIFVEISAVADTPILEVEDAQGNEDSQIALDVTSDFIDNDNSEILSVRIENVPDGASLNKGFKDENGIWHLNKTELENLLLTPTLHDGIDFTLKVIAQTEEKENGNVASISKDLKVTVDAIADNVELDLFQELSGEEKVLASEDASIIFLDIKSTFIDTDGSESVHYLVEGLPEGTTLNQGEELEVGKWKILPSELEDLGIFLKEHSDKDFRLKITAVTTEEENGHQEETIKYIDCEVESIADFANLNVENAQGLENDFIDLDISSSLIDTDGSESLKIVIEQVPDKAVLSSGVKDENGHWHLSIDELEGLQIRPEFNSTQDFELKVKAVTTEAKNGSTEESIALLNVKVNEIPKDVNIIVKVTEVLEDQECPLDVKIDHSTLRSSDSVLLEFKIPEGTSLNQGEKLSNGNWKLREDDLSGLKLNTPQNYAGSFLIDIIPTVYKSNGTVIRSQYPTKLPVDITPVADEVTLDVQDININEDHLIYLNLDAKLSDLDGSETLHVEIKGIPSDALLNVGEKQGDTWIVAQKDIALVAILPSENASGNIDLEIKAVGTDSNNDTYEVIKNMQINVAEVVDAPILHVVDSFIQNNEARLSIDTALRDLDSSEVLQIRVSNLPDGAILNQGTLNEDGSYTLNTTQIDDLKIQGLSDEAFEVKIEAISNDKQTIEKIINVSPVSTLYPSLLDSESPEYNNLMNTINAIDENASMSIRLMGVPSGASLTGGVLNGDGSYLVTKEELSTLKIIGADEQDLSLSFNIQSSLEHTYEPIEKSIHINTISSSYRLTQDDNFNSQYQNIISSLNGKDATFEIEGVDSRYTLDPSGTENNGVYTFTQSEIESLKINDVSGNAYFTLRAIIPNEIVTTNDTQNFDVSIAQTREMPFMNISDLHISTTTQEGSKETFSDAVDNVQSGGGNDELYTHSGADTINSDESDGFIQVAFNLNSLPSDIKEDETVIYRIEALPTGAISNIGYLNNGVLIIEDTNFNGMVNLSYPYQDETLSLRVSTHIVNENNLNEYLSSASIQFNIDANDVSGNDYIDAGAGNDTIDSGDKDDIILAKAGDDLIFAGNGNDYIDGGAGSDRIDAGAGDDSIVMDAEDFDNNRFITEIIDAGEGFDTVTIQDDEGVTFDMGLTNVEKFIGGSGNDNIIGSDQADIVRGGDGADTYLTGAGDDTVYIDGEDIKAQNGSFVDTGAGYDKIYIDEHESVNFDVSNTKAEEIISGSGDDILRNSTTSTVKIFGMEGNDTIFASNSEDILDGGEGSDTIDYSNSQVGVNVNLNTGEVSGGYAQGDTISNFENIVGTNKDDTLTGNNEDNTFDAKNGNNTIDGFGGKNSVIFSGSLKDYVQSNSLITAFNSTATVFTNSGINELSNINTLQFDDYEVYIDGTVNAPFVYDDTLSTTEDTPLRVNPATLLANDFSLENSNLRIVEVKNSENGVVTLNSDGTITFNPNSNYNSSTNNTFDKNSALYKGRAGFEYVVEDEHGNRSTAYSSVSVAEVNDKPTISSHSFYRNSLITGHGKIVINDVDSDVSAMDISVVSSLTYQVAGPRRWWWEGHEGNIHTRTGYVNINGRTPNDDGVFHFDYRGNYIRDSRTDMYEMRPFVIKVSDQGDIGTGSNSKSVLLHTGVYYQRWKTDPLVVDLDGDGIEIEEKYFEAHNDTLTAVASDDAILVWDFDQDGTISSDLETNWVGLSQTAQNDLEALREVFDTNQDGLFNEQDEEWNNFALWQDKNSDGLVSDDEFVKIAESKVLEFNLTKDEEKEENYPVVEYASYTTKTGEEHEIGAAYLDITSTEEKLSEEDKLILQQAAKLNEQLAASSNNQENYDEVVLVDDLDNNDENLEENIA